MNGFILFCFWVVDVRVHFRNFRINPPVEKKPEEKGKTNGMAALARLDLGYCTFKSEGSMLAAITTTTTTSWFTSMFMAIDTRL